MQDNTQDLQKQLVDAKEQLNWLRKNFNEEINILIKENRELKEQLKTENNKQQMPVEKTSNIEAAPMVAPVIKAEPIQEINETATPEPVQQAAPSPQAPPEISSIRWVLEWMVCKFKDWFIRLPCTVALLLYHIFAIQYHKHLCNKR